jgi:hypothetical protein
MADDRNKMGRADSSRINVNEPYEVQYWSKALGCSPDQLRRTVQRVGVMAADVRRALKH